MFKILIIANFVIAFLDLLMGFFVGSVAYHKFCKDFPNVRVGKSPFVVRVAAYMRALIVALLPIANLLSLLCVIFAWDTAVDSAYETIVDRME